MDYLYTYSFYPDLLQTGGQGNSTPQGRQVLDDITVPSQNAYVRLAPNPAHGFTMVSYKVDANLIDEPAAALAKSMLGWLDQELFFHDLELEERHAKDGEDLSTPAKVSVSPNPTDGYLLVRLPEQFANQTTKFQLKTLDGNQVFNASRTGLNHEFNFDRLPRGLYYLECRSQEEQTVVKVILQ